MRRKKRDGRWVEVAVSCVQACRDCAGCRRRVGWCIRMDLGKRKEKDKMGKEGKARLMMHNTRTTGRVTLI